jgi:hypothetical protein
VISKRVFVSIGGFIVTGIGTYRFFASYNIDALIAALVGLTAYVTELCWAVEKPVTSKSLSNKSKVELASIARELRIRGFTKMNDKELVKAIVENNESTTIQYRHWNKYKISLLALILPVGFLSAVVFPDKVDTAPEIEICWYNDEEGQLRLVRGGRVPVLIESSDLAKQQVRLPIRLALRNEEQQPLEIVRVELTYGAELEVNSAGRAKIDPKGRTLVYEHEIGTLEEVETFTPLTSVDVVTIPRHFLVVPTVLITAEGVPVYSVASFSISSILQNRFNLGFRVFCRDRKPLSGVVSFRLEIPSELSLDLPECEVQVPDATDIAFYAGSIESSEVVQRWEGKLKWSNEYIEYEKRTLGTSTFQAVHVDNVLRRLTLDTESDGNVDVALIDTSGDGVPDVRYRVTEPFPMMEWDRSAIGE